MDIGLEEIERIANLSRIVLKDEEKDIFANQLANVLDYIEKINELDTTMVGPMAYATNLTNVFREDELMPSLPRQKTLDISPSNVNSFIKVPKVIG